MLEEWGALLLEKIRQFPRRLMLPLSIATLGVIFSVYGLIQYIDSRQSAAEDVNSPAVLSATQSAMPIHQITIDIEGAVLHPGVYALPLDSRLQDALIAAGGMSSNADRVLIAKQLNMAAKLSDSMKVYIPHSGESQISNSQFQISNTSGSPISSNSSSAVISINTASAQDLDALPGVGAVTAQKIINGRPYASIDDLLNKKIVSSKVFNQIKDLVSL